MELNGIIISNCLAENKLTENGVCAAHALFFVQNRYNKRKYCNFIIKYGKILNEKIADVIILYKKIFACDGEYNDTLDQILG